jgi:hypothetical protein
MRIIEVPYTPRRYNPDGYRVLCEVCKGPFWASRRDAKYCSDACRQWAHRRRKEDQETHKLNAFMRRI